MVMLVSFSKNSDIQYHAFDCGPDRYCFFFDPIYRAFIEKGYTWSGIPFPEELVDKCMFTFSVVDPKHYLTKF